MKALILPLVLCICFSCTKKKNTITSSNQQGYTNTSVNGTWLLYQYQINNSTSIILKSDTLIFSSISDYTYNNVACNYYMYDMSLGYRVTLKNTVFGDITGILPYNFESSKEINGIKFSNIYSSNNSNYLMWLRKL